MQKVRKPLSILLSLIMALSVFTIVPPLSASAEVTPDRWRYTVNAAGTECAILGYDATQFIADNVTELTIPSKINGIPVTSVSLGGMNFPKLATMNFYEDSAVTEMPFLGGFRNFAHVNVLNGDGTVIEDTLPGSITKLPAGAFWETDVIKINLNNVTEVGGDGIYGAFEDCDKLGTVTFEKRAVIQKDSFRNASSEDGCTVTYYGPLSDWTPDAYCYSPKLVVNCNDGSCGWCGGDAPDYNCLYWTMDLAGNLDIARADGRSADEYSEYQVIRNHNWGDSKVRTITLDGMDKIIDYDFKNWPLLERVVLSDSVKEIDKEAFKDCTALERIELSENLTTIGSEAFKDCSSLREIKLPDSLTSIGEFTFNGCTSLREVEFPDSLTSIGKNVFDGCTSLIEVEFPDSLTSIGNSAFSSCTSLREVEFPDSLTSIGDYAFFGCTSLREVEFPDALTSVGGLAFYGCTSLREAEFPSGVTVISSELFDGCSSLSSVRLSAATTEIHQFAFRNCTSLTSIELPDGVTFLGQFAFDGCTSLKDIYYDGTQAQWEAIEKEWNWNLNVSPDFMVHVRHSVTVTTEGSGTAGADANTASTGSPVTLNATPADGWYFTGYQVVSGGAVLRGNVFLMPEEDVTVKAVFAQRTQKVTMVTEGEGVASSDLANPGVGDTVTLTATPASGWSFKEWRVNPNTVAIENNQFTMPDQPVVITAVFEAVTHSITVIADEGGAASASVDQAVKNEMIYLSATPLRGYTFDGFEVVSGGANVYYNYWFAMPGEDVVLRAKFSPKHLGAITVTSTVGGTAAAGVAEAYEGERVTLTATASKGYRLKEVEVVSDNVGIDSTDTPGVYTFGMPAEDVVINAVFAPAYAVDTDDNVEVVRWVGWDAEQVTEAMENEELSIELLDTAQPADGFYFTGEYLLNNNSLGSVTESGATWYISDFVMPAYDVMIEAVQAEQEILTVDLAYEDTAEFSGAALMQMSRDVEMTYDETTEADLLDLNNSGTPDLSFSVTYVYDANGEEIVDMLYSVQRLADCDARGEYSYTFTGTTDHYSELCFILPKSQYFTGHSISLNGDIALNFYIDLTAEEAQNASVMFIWDKDGKEQNSTVDLSEAPHYSCGYKVSCNVSAADMTANIYAALVIDNEIVADDFYSVMRYANVILFDIDFENYYIQTLGKSPEKYDNLRELIKAMLNYGAYAQKYFDRNSENLANDYLSGEDKQLGYLDSTTIGKPYESLMTHLPDGVTFSRVSLSLQSETTLSLYFESDKELSFSCDERTVEKDIVNGYQVARIRGIKAKELGNYITLNVLSNGLFGQVTYCPLTYCANVLDRESDNLNLRDVVTALYWYWDKAVAYFDN